MTVIEDEHAAHGATFTTRGGRRVVADYGRPARSHTAVRRVVGVVEHATGVLIVEGEDRVVAVDSAVTNRVPRADGEGCYAFSLDADGNVGADVYVYNAAAGDRLLVFVPPGESERLVEDWRGSMRDVRIDVATDEFAVFGVYGPKATEKVASVLNGASSPGAALSFVRGSMVDTGVTVIRDDGLAGEEGYLVVCAASEGADVFDTLVNRGLNAAPFGYTTWGTLTLEAGTPLFGTELRGRRPGDLGVRNAVDPGKGDNDDGDGGRRLVGLQSETVPESGAPVLDGDDRVGTVTRGVDSPSREEPIAFALVAADCSENLAVRVDGERHPASREALPFVEGSDASARRPRYPDD